ncbi:conserved exported hypothetical protein [uncultured Paludibacter sp.]|uniref:GH16 domain-containing protein n=1 Tax=uncultured Paludibacter sp. TaxID=497635 RepID=A0A653A6R8_9BACT|nr:conserved exported hypothetical protein [uncultured Paludibacter sp.]
MKNTKGMKIFLMLLFTMFIFPVFSQPNNDWKLVWKDEFDVNGKLNDEYWNFEHGFVRNNEAQWYQEENTSCKNGILIIEARHEKKANSNYQVGSNNWRKNREFADYTSSSINTRGKKEFLYGRFEIRARIDTLEGLWPAIWTLGVEGQWARNGEIDIMECYPINGTSHILANVATGTEKEYVAKWDSKTIPVKNFVDKDKNWIKKFHIWRMDWDKDYIRLFLDDELLNTVSVEKMKNPDGSQPFHQPHYILLNLAIGGNNGGDPSHTKFPSRYEIDYVRVYQK